MDGFFLDFIQIFTGRCFVSCLQLLPSTIYMMGRIAPQMVQQYLQKIRGQHTLSHVSLII